MQVYDEVLVPRLFVPWARLLLDELALRPGETVLDLACGPGSVTILAAERVGPCGRVSGLDLSPAMLELARAKDPPPGAPPIEYREAPADELPFADSSFDVATCQQGLQFFPQRQAALAELRRVLRPGGRLGVAVWSEIGDSPLFAALYDALREVAGDELADRYRAGPWGLPGAEALADLLTDAGFTNVRIEQRTVQVVFEGGAAQFASTLAASGIAAELEALEPEQKADLVRVFAERAVPLAVDGAIHSPTVSNLAFARR
jgi:ubiquinone/menaquinone biosynthesis C-methylase UbiE